MISILLYCALHFEILNNGSFFLEFESDILVSISFKSITFRLEQLNVRVNPDLRTERHMFCLLPRIEVRSFPSCSACLGNDHVDCF